MAKVKLNLAGFRQVRQSAGAMHVITMHAQRIAQTANELSQTKNAHYDYAVSRTVEHGSVALATTRGNGNAAYDNAKHNTLLKAVKQQ